jgi:hypothetical protein
MLVVGAAPASAAVKWTDYCGGSGRSAIVPDHWFKASFTYDCRVHDNCYAKSSKHSRLSCDQGLRVEMRSSCLGAYGLRDKDYSRAKYNLCLVRTGHYYVGVRVGAKKFYKGSGNPK